MFTLNRTIIHHTRPHHLRAYTGIIDGRPCSVQMRQNSLPIKDSKRRDTGIQIKARLLKTPETSIAFARNNQFILIKDVYILEHDMPKGLFPNKFIDRSSTIDQEKATQLLNFLVHDTTHLDLNDTHRRIGEGMAAYIMHHHVASIATYNPCNLTISIKAVCPHTPHLCAITANIGDTSTTLYLEHPALRMPRTTSWRASDHEYPNRLIDQVIIPRLSIQSYTIMGLLTMRKSSKHMRMDAIRAIQPMIHTHP